MDFFDDEDKKYSDAVYLELDAMLEKHNQDELEYEDQHKYKTFQLHWEPKRIIFNEFQNQFVIFVKGKTYESYEFVLSTFEDKGRAHVSDTTEEIRNYMMKDLGDRSQYKILKGRISDHYSQQYKMRQTEIEFVYFYDPKENCELIHLWCGGIMSIWRRFNKKGHFKHIDT